MECRKCGKCSFYIPKHIYIQRMKETKEIWMYK
jgi:hypothetical protein